MITRNTSIDAVSPLLAWACICWASAGVVVPAFGADDGGFAWQPRDKAVAVTRVETAGPDGKSTVSVRIRGRMEHGWNYASTRPLALAPGKLYRLSAWLRVESLDPGSPAPYFKCEFTAAAAHRTLGQAHTDRYDTSRFGTCQRVVGEFRSPEKSQNAWLAVEKDAMISGTSKV